MHGSYQKNKFAMRVHLYKRDKLHRRIGLYKRVRCGECRRIVEEDRSRMLRDLEHLDRIWARNRTVR